MGDDTQFGFLDFKKDMIVLFLHSRDLEFRIGWARGWGSRSSSSPVQMDLSLRGLTMGLWGQATSMDAHIDIFIL